jgi:hypothetical protein
VRLTLLLSSIFVKSSDLMDWVSRVSNTVRMRSPPAQQGLSSSNENTHEALLEGKALGCLCASAYSMRGTLLGQPSRQ